MAASAAALSVAVAPAPSARSWMKLSALAPNPAVQDARTPLRWQIILILLKKLRWTKRPDPLGFRESPYNFMC